MLVLGIDPGTAICGYGFVETDGVNLTAREYDAILTDSKMRQEDRLVKIFDSLDALIKKNHPDVLGVEKLFFYNNISTAIPVGQARGVILLAAAKNQLEIVELSPPEVKQSVTGYGKATKDQVIFMVTKLLKLNEPPNPDDVADALAIAIGTIHRISSPVHRNRY